MTLPGYPDIPDLTQRAADKYPIFLATLRKNHPQGKEATSKRIETRLGISGPEVRALKRLAWAEGHPVGTGAKGYFWMHRVEECRRTSAHIKARIAALESDLSWLEAIETGMLREDAERRQSRMDLGDG